MAEHIAGLPRLAPLDSSDYHGEGIISIIFRRGHWQPNDQRCFIVKNARRKHQKGMNIPHFPTDLWVTVNPDDILTIRHPRAAFAGCRPFCGYQRSAPIA